MLWEFWFNRFQWGMVAKHSLNPKNFSYASTLTAAQVTALPEEVDGKDRLASEQTLISNLYLCLGEKGQDELHKRRPHLDLSTTRYSRVLDTIETEFKKERNETYETFQLLARKQQIGESLKQFRSVLSELAARCNFGTLETRILQDVIIGNMNNREAQNELCRSTKTPEEVYRIALSYERGYKYAKSYGSATGEQQLVAPPVEMERSQSKRNRWGQSEKDTEKIDSAAVDRSEDEQRSEGEFLEDAIIVTNSTLLRNTLLNVQPKMRRVISAGKRDITKELVGESGIIGEDRQWDQSKIRRIWKLVK